MASGRPPCWTAHLLLVLVVAARCDADQQQQPQQQQQQQQFSGDALDQLLALVSRAVATSADPIVADLGSQRTLLDGIVSRLEVQDARLDALKVGQDAQMGTLNARLDTLSARLDSQDTQLNTLKDSLDRQDTQLNTLKDSLDRQDTQLNTLKDSLDSQDTQLNTLKDSLDRQDTQLNTLKDSVVSQDTLLNTLRARLDSAAAGQERNCTRPESHTLPRDCGDLPAGARTGVYTLQPGRGGGEPVDAYCDMGTDGGGWLVFQRRADILPRENFYRNWTEYREGFGELTVEFWWGLEKLWLMTSPLDRRYELRVDLEDFDGSRRYALYKDFGISSENDGYRMTGGKYSGNAGDSLSRHFKDQFSTKDRDQDATTDNCAQIRKGAWWYDACHDSNLNGEYLSGTTPKDIYGINWKTWRGLNYSLKTVEMKVRPTGNLRE